MKTSLQSTLEQAIQDWAESATGRKDWPNREWSPEASEEMAKAALAALRAHMNGQKLAKAMKD